MHQALSRFCADHLLVYQTKAGACVKQEVHVIENVCGLQDSYRYSQDMQRCYTMPESRGLISRTDGNELKLVSISLRASKSLKT